MIIDLTHNHNKIEAELAKNCAERKKSFSPIADDSEIVVAKSWTKNLLARQENIMKFLMSTFRFTAAESYEFLKDSCKHKYMGKYYELALKNTDESPVVKEAVEMTLNGLCHLSRTLVCATWIDHSRLENKDR